jgi:hypothetical protein
MTNEIVYENSNDWRLDRTIKTVIFMAEYLKLSKNYKIDFPDLEQVKLNLEPIFITNERSATYTF